MRAIQIWPFYDAPEQLRKLSGHGGDEDWLALVPVELVDEHLVEAFFTHDYLHGIHNPFGVSGIDRHDLPNGDAVFIGAHA